MSFGLDLPKTPAPAPLVRCDYCRQQVNPKGGLVFSTRFMCKDCLAKKGVR
jgi:hypothetical protein